MLYDRLDDELKGVDPLITAAADFNLLRARSPGHGVELISWTDHLFETLKLAETPAEQRLRHAACLLADIGWRAHPDYRGEQSLNIIANAALVGIDHPGRAYLALSSFFRHEGLSIDKASPQLKSLATPRLIDLARILAGAFRVAYPHLRGDGGRPAQDGFVRARRPDRARPARRHGAAGRRAAARAHAPTRQVAGARAAHRGRLSLAYHAIRQPGLHASDLDRNIGAGAGWRLDTVLPVSPRETPEGMP